MSVLMEAAEMTLGPAAYSDYISSLQWKRRRDIRRNMGIWRGRRFCCEWCGCFCPRRTSYLTHNGIQWATNVEIHHLTYDRLGCERFDDLLMACSACHTELHAFINKLTAKGFCKRYVMQRMQPYCIRRMLAIYELFNHAAIAAWQ